AVPAASSVLVHLDPTGASTGLDGAVEVVRGIVEGFDATAAGWPPGTSTLEVPVRYGGADGPDLDAVAELSGLSRCAVIELHASTAYRVLFLGFAPGFGYLGPLPAGLIGPRRASPRVRVPAGSVAIAGQHTAVYPVESPGGWQLLGRTSAAMWDPRRSPPALLEPGMLVRFVPEGSR
ncbi:MAG TPA: 5-oxoprolinase subunit PxpB, partial [Candidatus Limnocylindrales bacterium]|nr:5-oxoprolinase subunit PxpB [Candidatus Limnocylindrales bacterium]